MKINDIINEIYKEYPDIDINILNNVINKLHNYHFNLIDNTNIHFFKIGFVKDNGNRFKIAYNAYTGNDYAIDYIGHNSFSNTYLNYSEGEDKLKEMLYFDHTEYKWLTFKNYNNDNQKVGFYYDNELLLDAFGDFINNTNIFEYDKSYKIDDFYNKDLYHRNLLKNKEISFPENITSNGNMLKFISKVTYFSDDFYVKGHDKEHNSLNSYLGEGIKYKKDGYKIINKGDVFYINIEQFKILNHNDGYHLNESFLVGYIDKFIKNKLFLVNLSNFNIYLINNEGEQLLKVKDLKKIFKV